VGRFPAGVLTGGLRWGEATALHVGDIDWSRSRLYVQRAWSEDGGRIEATKDGEDRWVKLPASALEALRAHVEAMALDTRDGAFSEHIWRPLLAAAKLPYRKPHAMRHSYATWGSSRVALTSGGCNGNWGTRRSLRPATPTGISSPNGTSNG
jgi:integrase